RQRRGRVDRGRSAHREWLHPHDREGGDESMNSLLFRKSRIATFGCWLLLLVYTGPLAWIVLESLASDRVAGAGFPTEFNFDGYARVISRIAQPIVQSTLIAASTAALVVVFSALAGYGLSH